MFVKHEELDKEMDLQMHLHEPRRLRIETNIYNVRAGKNSIPTKPSNEILFLSRNCHA
jgi:hypothetical protein